MDHFAGIDVSLEQSSVCVVDATGKFVQETKVAREPEAVVGAMLMARASLHSEFMRLHRKMLGIVRENAVCRRLMRDELCLTEGTVTPLTKVCSPGAHAGQKAVNLGT